MNVPTDVLIVGLGPAGRALAHRCLVRGLSVAVVDPHPDRGWTPTYACWADELPAWLGSEAIARTVSRAHVWTTHRQVVDRSYTVLDTARLQAALSIEGAQIHPGTAETVTANTVTLVSGATLAAATVIDARGSAPGPGIAQQTAYGAIVPDSVAASVLDGADMWFMDWRSDNDASPSATPSFLYAIPLGGGRYLLEETCLVGRPALSMRELRRRLEARLADRGLRLTGEEEIERVRIAVQPPPADSSDAVAFGARAGMMHPATGYSVAESLSSADPVARALAEHRNPVRVLWSPPARLVHTLRGFGLRALLALPPAATRAFFEAFFALSVADQRAYLSDRGDLRGAAVAMTRIFGRLPAAQRRTVIGAAMPRIIRSTERDDSTIMEQ